MKKYVYAAICGLFIGSCYGVASAAEQPKPPTKVNQPGRCWREVSFNETRDGSFVVRSAWRCEQKRK